MIREVRQILANVSLAIPEPDEFQVEAVSNFDDLFLGLEDSGEFQKYALVLAGYESVATELKFSKLRLLNLVSLELVTNQSVRRIDSAVVLEVENDCAAAFEQIAVDVILLIGQGATSADIHTLVRSWANLLQSQDSVDDRTVIGLWGELFFLNRFIDISQGLKSWHVDPSDRWDFMMAAGHPVEVKTSTRSRRVHHFSSNQINEHSPDELVIASILTARTDAGTSLRDLIDELRPKMTGAEYSSFLAKVAKICNPFSKRLEDIRLDEVLAASSIKLYSIRDLDVPAFSHPILSAKWEIEFDEIIPKVPASVKRRFNKVIA